MKELGLWFQNNDLIINIKKTGAMFHHSKQFRLPNKPQIVFNSRFNRLPTRSDIFLYLHYRKFKIECPYLFTTYKFE
jgi:hypothetical protein